MSHPWLDANGRYPRVPRSPTFEHAFRAQLEAMRPATPFDCAHGWCTVFAAGVEKRFPGATAVAGNGHDYIEYKGRFYDSEHPAGVASDNPRGGPDSIYENQQGFSMKVPQDSIQREGGPYAGAYAAGDPSNEGHWVTVNGQHLYVKD